MNIEVWSDVVCPWCYIGKRHLEGALADFEHAGEATVLWRSFQLDPTAPAVAQGDPIDRLASKYGMSRERAQAAQNRVSTVAAQAGLDFHLDRARSGNTFNAHRLLHLAATMGKQGQLKERLMAAYFVEGEPIGDRDVLIRLAAEVGIDAGASGALLDGDDYADDVRADIEDGRGLGITGVPYFVINRKYGISGAQPAELILQALHRAWADEHPLEMIGESGSETACADDSCAIPDRV